MTVSLHRIYWYTGFFALLGFIWYFWAAGFRDAFGFALGALGSLGNFWLYDRITRRLAPGPDRKRPWEAGAFILRYAILLGIGYAIVKSLNVSPLAVVLGLLASTAAVIASLVAELFSYFFKSKRTSQ